MLDRAMCIAQYGSDYKIRQMIAAGKLFKVGKAIYSKDKNVPEIAVLAFQYPEAVVTLDTAFYIYGLTDVIPCRHYLATKRNAAKIKNIEVQQIFVPDDFFEQGVVNLDYKGYSIRIYNKERMLVELLRYKAKLPFDYYKEILLNFRKIIPTLDMQKIQDYVYDAPKSGKITETLQMEVL